VYSSEKSSGSYRTLLELDSYAAMDKLAAMNKDARSEYGRLLRESARFGDYDLAAPWSNALLKTSSTRPSGIRRPEACITVSAAGSGRRLAGRGMPRPRRTHCSSSGDVLGRPRRVGRPDLTGRDAHLGISKATPRSAHT
jgi:hypothetical protein